MKYSTYNSELVFATSHGTPIEAGNLRHAFARAVRRAEVQTFRGERKGDRLLNRKASPFESTLLELMDTFHIWGRH